MINKLNNNKKIYSYIDHLSDIGIEAYGSSLEEVFENAALGMFSIICDLTNIKQIKRKKIFIKTEGIMEMDDLLLLWLEKLLYVYEVEKMLFSKFDISQIENKNNYKSINAPCLIISFTFSGFLANILTVYPALRRFFIIGFPMIPVPINPISNLILLP